MQKNHKGMTLIEVLIAMAIIAIAMTAIIKSTTQNIRGTGYLQTKSIAMWVGQYVLNEARVGVLKIDGEMTDKTEMLGQDWYWQAKEETTPNKNIKKIDVDVYDHDIDDADAASIVSMQTYVYTAQGEEQHAP